jgi:HPt (histidine-containing phosphotransfer) domain-containing protein
MPGHAMRDFGARRSVAPVRDPVREAAPSRPIDLVHLSRQSLGDRALEIELLTLFERQAEHIADCLSAPPGNGERRRRHDLAHTLKGSARAVGALAVAAAAQAYEAALYSGGETAVVAARDDLLAAVAVARSAVLDLIAEG